MYCLYDTKIFLLINNIFKTKRIVYLPPKYLPDKFIAQ